MSGIFGTATLAFGIRLSALRIKEGVARARDLGMCRVRVPDVGDGGHDFPGYADSLAGLVSGHVVGDEPEERRQRAGPAASSGPEELRDGMDVAAQITSGNGAARARSANRQDRGG